MIAPRLYVDSADLAAVSALLADSLVHGVTTNPTILERAGRTVAEIPELYARWVEEGAREVFFQAWGADASALEERARAILALGDRAVVKVPATRAGFGVAARLAREGAPVLLTAVFTPAQALAAASSGIRYLAAYLGRMRDAGFDAVSDIARMQAACGGSGSEVLAASLRSPEDVVELAEARVPAFTAAPAVLEAMLAHPATVDAADAFEASPSLRA
ncbi:transaldolase family protein [Agrococcus lahaulensis]|uniref:transaldolase family protein n=1 Tax=Agrococcus lahaulensis TaxID=341722 RepID=UPI00054FD497|nr:transaldolase family protein [Agrococcus lahaulensis]